MKYNVIFGSLAKKDIEKLRTNNLLNKAKSLIEIIADNPYQNPPPYEKLVGNLKGKISRRINIKHRLVYEVDETDKIIIVLRMWSHYE